MLSTALAHCRWTTYDALEHVRGITKMSTPYSIGLKLSPPPCRDEILSSPPQTRPRMSGGGGAIHRISLMRTEDVREHVRDDTKSSTPYAIGLAPPGKKLFHPQLTHAPEPLKQGAYYPRSTAGIFISRSRHDLRHDSCESYVHLP